MKCEVENCNEVKYQSIITEYSVFGHEYMALCKTHYQEHMEEKKKPKDGYCERCGNTEGEDIRPYQDPEEGCAAVYLDTCVHCRKQISEAFCD